MPRSLKTLGELNADSLGYLGDNTDITYLSEGSIARALIEATNLEISRLGEYVASTYSNTFIDSAQGAYLDLIGDLLGVSRIKPGQAIVTSADQSIQLSVSSGTLGDKFPNPKNSNLGIIPIGLSIKSNDQSIVYKTTEVITFPYNATEIFISASSDDTGISSNIGKGRLVIHDGPSGVNVTNIKTIANATDLERDADYRYRLSNSVAGAPTSNEVAVRLSLAGMPDLARVELKEFARGAGTFDALLVPAGNTLSAAASELARRSVEEVSAFGISSRVVEPKYKRFKVSVQLIPASGSGTGSIDANRLTAKNAILDYFESIPMGGELIINRLRASIISAISQDIKDIKVIELCFNSRPQSVRNSKLRPDELFTLDNSDGQAIFVI
jgi:uncharacterized phage protein gp47/JayE